MTAFHIIRQQYLNVTLDGSESDGLALQRNLPALCHHVVTPAIDRTLERCAPAEGHLCIERLEIDIGTMALDRLEHDLAKTVAEALENSLRDLVPAGELLSDIVSDNVRYKTARHSIDEAFIHFLTTGSLLWSFRLPEGKPLEQVILSSWQEAAESGISPYAANNDLIGVLASATVRKRLIRQFSPIFMDVLLSLLSPEGKKAMDEVLQLLHGSNETPAATKQFEQHLWETAFAKIAARESFTSMELVGETWRGLHLAAPGDGAPANVLERYRPTMTNNASATTDRIKGVEAGPTKHGKAGPPSRIEAMPQIHAEPAPSSRIQAEAQSRTAPVLSNQIEQRPKSHIEARPPSHGEFTPPGHIEPGPKNHSEPRPPILAEQKPRSHARPESPGSVEPELHRHIEPDLQNQPESRPPSPVDQEPQSHEQQRSPSRAEHVTQSPVASRKKRIDTSRHPEARAGIYIENAGLVLLHPFLPRFFEALEIAAADKLLQPERALCLLHFLTTGRLIAPEYDLVLPKILCNVPLLTPINSNVTLTAIEQEEGVALLQAVIRHWEALRNTSPDGLRGTFLLRPGKVSLRDDGDWLLQVEAKSCDILLDSLPWGISMTSLPWMESMLWVEWR